MLDTIVRKTYGFHKKEDRIATSQFIEATGLPNFAIHKARKKLLVMNMITITHKGNSQILTYSIQKDYHKWKPLPKKVIVTVTQKGNCIQKRCPLLPKKVTNCNPKGDTQKIKDTYTINIKPQPSKELKAALDEISKGGLNIYALINKLKKQMDLPKDFQFPEEVLLKVCQAYDKKKIQEPWPWFVKVIKDETAMWHANKQINLNRKDRNMAPSLKELLKGIK